jgi:hypothetical protein
MAKLGDAVSDEDRRKSAERQLEAGLVIYLEVVYPLKAFVRSTSSWRT